jgi:hypothetical protein
MEIRAELPKLDAAERREILDRLCDLEEQCLLDGAATPEEKALLDHEADEYRRNPGAGLSREEVESGIRKPSRT